jgi:hypothetical protein
LLYIYNAAYSILYTVSGKSCSAMENFFFFTGAMMGSENKNYKPLMLTYLL